MIISNEVDFFEDVEKTYGDRLPSQSCSFGNDWDLHSATLAEDTARVKRAVEKLRAAEALATLVSLQEPGFLKARKRRPGADLDEPRPLLRAQLDRQRQGEAR